MAARILAFVVAVAMVAGALWYRGRDDEEGADAPPSDVAADAPLRLVCATELEAVCEAIVEDADEEIALTIEPAGTTADRLTAVRGAAGLEVWMTPGPWPAIVRDARTRAGNDPLIQAPTPAVGRGRVGIAMWNERAGALTKRCPIDLKCLGEAAADGVWTKSGGPASWGDVKLGLADPGVEAAGLTALGAATLSFFGTNDVSSTDLERDDYRRWLAGVARARRPSDLSSMLAVGPSVLDAVISLEPVVRPVITSAARRTEVTVIYPSGVATADVVLGTVPGRRADRLVEILRGREARETLTRGGWSAPTGPPGPRLDAGLLAALRGAWSEARR